MSHQPASAHSAPDAMRGFAAALLCYIAWGLLPFYMKQLADVPVAEVIAHRVLWALPCAGLLLLFTGGMPALRQAVRAPRVFGMAAVTASLITCNWGVYTWAVINDRTLDTALGYYINPLVSVLLGVALLGERLDRAQKIAIALAASAVALLALRSGGIPWVSLALPVTFAMYGYLRKTMPVGALQGFTLEVLILSVPAAAYVAWLTATGGNHFGAVASDSFWLMMAGPVTAGPLVLFAVGARNLQLSTIGVMQYLAPTLAFLVAVFAFGEPFSPIQAAAFGLIWVGLAIFTWSSLARRRR